MTRDRAARIIVKSDGCEGLTGEINYIESVQLVVTMTYPKRGDIQIAMRSPLGILFKIIDKFIKLNKFEWRSKVECWIRFISLTSLQILIEYNMYTVYLIFQIYDFIKNVLLILFLLSHAMVHKIFF